MQFTDRLMVPADLPQVKALLEQQERAVGCELDLPDFFKPPILAAIVREYEGRIIACLYFEANVEMCIIGTDPRAMVGARKAVKPWLYHLRQRGFRLFRTFVPHSMLEPKGQRKSAVERVDTSLGFHRMNGVYEHFCLDLREPRAAALPLSGAHASCGEPAYVPSGTCAVPDSQARG